MAGRELGHYEIAEKIGAGGMGEVFRARDTRLERDVALKILPPDMAREPERLRRFEREAKAIAALNHPNIVTVYSVEEADGVHFLTMELVRGTTLSHRLSDRGLALGEFLDLAVPLADAVSCAHASGVTHRDLKPANIMLDADGRVKVLDFGLAKIAPAAVPGGDDVAAAVTVAADGSDTGIGRVVGTVAYMSPEQAEGKSVDQRSDIFSLGIVLYELITGKHPFSGDSPASTISSILRDTPPSMTELQPILPRPLSRIIMRCLAKEPSRRVQTALDLRNELEEVQRELDSGELEVAAPRVSPRPWWSRGPVLAGAAVLVAAALITLSTLGWRGHLARQGESPGPPQVRLTQLTELAGVECTPTISPDGRMVAYARSDGGNADIYLLRVGGDNPINLTADSPTDDYEPAFSPDGDRIAFRSEREGGGLFVMGATGESPRRVSDVGYHPTWSPDGSGLLFCTESIGTPELRSTTSQIWAVDLNTGSKRLISAGDAVQPVWSPNQLRIAYWTQEGGQRDLWTMRPDGTDPRAVTDDLPTDWYPVWSPDGNHLYFVSNRSGASNLWRLSIDEESGRVLGSPEPITTGTSITGTFSLSRDERRIACDVATFSGSIARVGFDPQTETLAGTPVEIIPVDLVTPQLSPDGEWIVHMTFTPSPQEDIHLIRSDGSGRRQLTDDVFKDRAPKWSPQGDRIAFFSNRSGSYDIWTIRADGSDLRQLTDTPEMDLIGPIWSPDGLQIACGITEGTNFLIHAGGDGIGEPQSAATLEILPSWDGKRFTPMSWSADGRRLAGVLEAADGEPIAVASHDLETGRYAHLIDIEEGSYDFPSWLPDSRRLLYHDGDRLLVLDSATLEVREITRIELGDAESYDYYPSRDGRTLLIVRRKFDCNIWLLDLLAEN